MVSCAFLNKHYLYTVKLVPIILYFCYTKILDNLIKEQGVKFFKKCLAYSSFAIQFIMNYHMVIRSSLIKNYLYLATL